MRHSLPVHLFSHVVKHRLAVVREVCAGESESAADQARDVESRVTADRAPDGYRQVEQQCLDQEDHRHPLVVRDHALVTIRPAGGDLFAERDVVGVADPAEAVGVLLVGAAEVCWDPAVDRLADVLLRRDNQREDDQDGGRVEVR